MAAEGAREVGKREGGVCGWKKRMIPDARGVGFEDVSVALGVGAGGLLMGRLWDGEDGAL